MIKQIVIPMAAFAVTATGVSAFNPDMLEKIDVDLSTAQIEAIEEAHEMRTEGADQDEIRQALEEAGVDRDTMMEIREAAREHRAGVREEVKEALDDEDYEAYLEAVQDTKRAGLIDSESDFEKLVEAHKLREAGDREAAREIMDELGFEKPAGRGHGDSKGFGNKRGLGTQD